MYESPNINNIKSQDNCTKSKTTNNNKPRQYIWNHKTSNND